MADSRTEGQKWQKQDGSVSMLTPDIKTRQVCGYPTFDTIAEAIGVHDMHDIMLSCQSQSAHHIF